MHSDRGLIPGILKNIYVYQQLVVLVNIAIGDPNGKLEHVNYQFSRIKVTNYIVDVNVLACN